MKMRKRGNGKGNPMVVLMGVLLAIGWIGAGAVSAQEARSKAEVVPADTAKVSPGGATFKVPAGWSVETAKDLEVLTPVIRQNPVRVETLDF